MGEVGTSPSYPPMSPAYEEIERIEEIERKRKALIKKIQAIEANGDNKLGDIYRILLGWYDERK